MDKQEKIEALKGNKEFIAKVNEVKSVDELIKAFADEGIEVTEEEVKSAAQLIGENGEIDESALDSVSGGLLGAILGTAAAIAGVCALASAARGFFDALKCK